MQDVVYAQEGRQRDVVIAEGLRLLDDRFTMVQVGGDEVCAGGFGIAWRDSSFIAGGAVLGKAQRMEGDGGGCDEADAVEDFAAEAVAEAADL